VLRHQRVLDAQAASIRSERARLQAGLDAIEGVRTSPSDANFILFSVPGAAEIFESLKRRGILIKKLAGSHPALRDCLRVTVGRPEENAAFLRALEESIEENGHRHA
jgi:histidinol-phosphate aminotransferase